MNLKKIFTSVLCAILTLFLIACGTSKETNYPPVSLSDDLFSFEFGLNGHKYTLPAEYQEFVDNNWAFTGNLTGTLKPDEYIEPMQIMYNGKDANSAASLFNSTEEKLDENSCKIAKFSVTYSAASYVPQIELPGGITMKSTYEDIIAAYGEPDSESEEIVNKLTYYVNEYIYVEFSIDTRNNSMFKITLANYLSDYEIEQ